MEYNSCNVGIFGHNQNGHDHNGFSPKKKKRSPLRFFRVALFMIKSKKSKQSKSESHGAVSPWKKFLGLCPRDPPLLAKGDTIKSERVITSPAVEHLEVFTPPMSPAHASVASSSSCGMSEYASATNLQVLDEGNEGDDEKDGDEMIDLKAEQFIAQFYQQMRLQHEAYANRRNRRLNGGR